MQQGRDGKFYNYSFGFSTNFHEFFTPFIIYSKTHRIKEVYFSEIGNQAVGIDLKTE
ncbi:hypothetical protein [Campylobacter portucalensis]|uniref:hypothetical protein n=1 Tax=Campylobacter portucalensis TaxID=2608384 RepID=UPI0012B3C23A|nr:hypothetical protein [Campylobacter portucalensis]